MRYTQRISFPILSNARDKYRALTRWLTAAGLYAAGISLREFQGRFQILTTAVFAMMGVVVYIPVEDVDLPFPAIWILYPELVLVGMTTVDVHFFSRLQSRLPDTPQMLYHGLMVLDLYTHVMHLFPAGRVSCMQSQIQRRDRRQELDVSGFDLDGLFSEELRVESRAAFQIVDCKRQVYFRIDRHGSPPECWVDTILSKSSGF